jgi:serine phosphatase RsbU (regulator of sigma subunit)/anti-sigma regulatory factor (Ser/Thr protein kinase)
MATLLETVNPWRMRRRREAESLKKPETRQAKRTVTPAVDIAPTDPLIAYFLSAPGPAELDKLHLDSPALRELRAAGVTLAIPLVSQGELIGLLNLGQRLSQQEYSTDDKRLLNTLATQAAPAVRVAQLVREQQAQARERERIEQELRIARLIQQTLLPKDLPQMPGWHLEAYYQPARAVGGDFYDFIQFEDGRLGLVIGDVTDKGVPAALVMATTRSILRTAAQNGDSPGTVLERANNLLCPDIPSKMFVTCQYAILDPNTGHLQYANAGHDLPYQRHDGSVAELRATGMPLGLLPGMHYEEKETILEPGESLLLYSDGLVEAHNPEREMFGFPRLMELLAGDIGEVPLVEYLLNALTQFTGSAWEQEDDVTLVTLRRQPRKDTSAMAIPTEADEMADENWQKLDEFTVPSEPGNERLAIRMTETAVRDLGIPEPRLERLKTAVGEATMNAMEHGNHYHPELPVRIEVLAAPEHVLVRVTDQGGHTPLPEPETPDLEAKLSGTQTPRGWGLFLIKSLVDRLRVTGDASHHTVELYVSRKGDGNADTSI